MNERARARLSAGIALTLTAAVLTACGGGTDEKKGKRGPSGPPQVGFVVVQPTNVPTTTELPGRTAAFETSEVRPQVAGLIRKRLFTEGSYVRAGQTLYQIDPRVYAAAVNEARGNLASAQANAEATRIQAERYRPLAQIEAVSKQDYTNAVASARQAAAAVQQTRAALETARINLNFTSVPAPISGRIGRSLFTVGALVTTSQTDPLAVIQRTDPMFVDIQQSAAELLSLRRALASGGVLPATAQVRLKLEDGSDYAQTGTIQFAEVTVNQSTGTVTLRARFPNPQNVLLPGMFVRAVFVQSILTGAFLVPQQAVSRDPQGNATLFVVGANNKAVQREVNAAQAQGPYWVVTKGLKAGDKVITQGTNNLKPNTQVRPVPANSPQNVKAPQKADGKGGSQGGGGGQDKQGTSQGGSR